MVSPLCHFCEPVEDACHGVREYVHEDCDPKDPGDVAGLLGNDVVEASTMRPHWVKIPGGRV